MPCMDPMGYTKWIQMAYHGRVQTGTLKLGNVTGHIFLKYSETGTGRKSGRTKRGVVRYDPLFGRL